MKIGNGEEKEDPKVTSEKAIIEKIKMLYKGKNKRLRDGQTNQVIEVDREVDVGEDELEAKKVKRDKLGDIKSGGISPKSGTKRVKNGPEIAINISPKSGNTRVENGPRSFNPISHGGSPTKNIKSCNNSAKNGTFKSVSKNMAKKYINPILRGIKSYFTREGAYMPPPYDF